MALPEPRARQAGLIIRELAEEVLVYDLERDRAYCLNHTAARVWKRCDGQTTPSQMASLLEKDLGVPVEEKLVWRALNQLGRVGLLEQRVALPSSLGTTRRQQLRALGKIAAVAAPLVSAVVAPPAADAASCKASGQPCAAPAQCCSGACVSSKCI